MKVKLTFSNFNAFIKHNIVYFSSSDLLVERSLLDKLVNIKGGVDLKISNCLLHFFCLFVLFIYMSVGCVSTFRTCVQVYLEI